MTQDRAKLAITRRFVRIWASRFDAEYEGGEDVETPLREWLATLPEPKYLDKEHFVLLACWKTKRQTSAYKRNDPDLVRDVTRFAFEVVNEKLKLHILTFLEGVGVPVASTILYFLQPDRFPIFDIHVRKTLQNAGLWLRSVNDASAGAWEQYVVIMRQLATSLAMSLRELDKALFAYDKWGKSANGIVR